MADVFIRMDARISKEHAERFLQGLRDLEQRHPEAIHLLLTILDHDGSAVEHLEMLRRLRRLRRLTPGFESQVVLARDEMSDDQKRAFDELSGKLLH
jgi:hypothetical protein